MIKKIITSLLILVVFAMNAKAQYAREREEFEAKQLIAPGALLVTGTALHCFAHSSLDVDINDYFVDLRARNGDKDRRLRSVCSFCRILGAWPSRC